VSIAAIETRYGGCRFRSRLEARWAVFFDDLGIPWEYESQGWDLDRLVRRAKAQLIERDEPEEWPWKRFRKDPAPDGKLYDLKPPPPLGLYLPDFWLPRQKIWFEVKGVLPERGSDEDERLDAFGFLVRCELVPGRQFVVAFGGIPRTGDPFGGVADGYAYQYGPYWDNLWAWNRCRVCGFLDMQFEGRAGRNACGCRGLEELEIHPDVHDAFEVARSARFEHGESG
jgi:hypothetical protein